jgi:flagellar motility protein MotE (MotC chaperone)
MESFKESISNRFEKQEENFKNLTNKVKTFEKTQREYKKRLSRFEDCRSNTDENEDIKLQQVKNFNLSYFSHFSVWINLKTIFMYQVNSKSRKLLEIREIQEKLKKIEKIERNLETLCSRVDHLENLSSRYNNNNGELQVVTTDQPSDVGNRQEQEVFTF